MTKTQPTMIRIAGVVIALFGLALAVEGGWLVWVGGTPAYLIAGIGYLVVGCLLIARSSAAFWLNMVLFVAALIWTFIETGFNQMTVLTALPRLDIPMIIAIILLIPWVWRPAQPSRLACLLPGSASLVLLVLGLVLLFGIMPWVNYPHGDMETANNGAHVKLANTHIAPGDWPNWGRTKGQSRYSPLDQINTDNVAQLEQAWSYQSGDMQHAYDASPDWGAESTPIIIGNTAYTCTPNAWVIALNATTGEQKWKFKPASVDETETNFVNCRGVAYYKAGNDYADSNGGKLCKTRIIAPTAGPYIVALDAKTGRKCPDFGDNGMLSLKQDIGRMAPGTLEQTAAPLVMDGLIYTGGNVYDDWFWGEPSGVVRAWDAVTGKEIWHWDLGKKIPTAPLDQGEIFTQATPNVWGQITGDPQHDEIFIGTGNATPDYVNPRRRPFDREYSDSIVALNAKTGKEDWHFQLVHNDMWDFDIGVGPTLVRWPDGHGGYIPALVQTTKQGDIFVLNRKTGKPIKKVVEKAAPSAPKNMQVYSKYKLSDTQPHSVAMPSFLPEKLKASDMWGATPFDQMWCRVRFHQLYYKGPFTPITTQGSLLFPTYDGLSDWYGASFSPDGQMNIVANYLPFVGTLVPRKQADQLIGLDEPWDGQLPPPPDPGNINAPQYGLPYASRMHPFWSPIHMPCNAPPWATLNQVDLVSGKIKWTTPLGNSRHTAPFGFKQFLPMASSVPELGSGIMTAGGVTFIAGTADDMLRAYDTGSGEILWSTYLPAGGQANPAIYKGKDGREYVVITAGGHQPLETIRGDYTLAFALPKKVVNQ